MLEAVTNIPTEAQVESTEAKSGVKRPLEDDTEVELPPEAAGVVWKMQGRSSNPSPSLASSWSLEREVSLEVAWRVDLHSCVDSSPLYLSKEGRQMVAIGSHSGQVLPSSNPNLYLTFHFLWPKELNVFKDTISYMQL